MILKPALILFVLVAFVTASKRPGKTGGVHPIPPKRPRIGKELPSGDDDSPSNNDCPLCSSSSSKQPSALAVPIPSFTSKTPFDCATPSLRAPPPPASFYIRPATEASIGLNAVPTTESSFSPTDSSLIESPPGLIDPSQTDASSSFRTPPSADPSTSPASPPLSTDNHIALAASSSSSVKVPPPSLLTILAMLATIDDKDNAGSSTSAPSPSTDRSAYLSKLSMLTLDGKDVAALLGDGENFFVDLPYVECVLPSMEAGEQIFVPGFIHKVLLPRWYGKRRDEVDGWFDDEQVIISLSKDYFAPAMSKYCKLLAFACLLEIRSPLDDFAVRSSKFPALSQFLNDHAGVNLESILTIIPNDAASLDAHLRHYITRIPAIVMIALQWGFAIKTVIINLAAFSNRIRKRIVQSQHWPLARFLGEFMRKIVLPVLYPSTVALVHWTMNPVYEMKSDCAGVMRMVPIVRLARRNVDRTRVPFDKDKLMGIKMALAVRSFNADFYSGELTTGGGGPSDAPNPLPAPTNPPAHGELEPVNAVASNDSCKPNELSVSSDIPPDPDEDPLERGEGLDMFIRHWLATPWTAQRPSETADGKDEVEALW